MYSGLLPWGCRRVSFKVRDVCLGILLEVIDLLLSAVDQTDYNCSKMVEWNNVEKKGIVKCELKQSV